MWRISMNECPLTTFRISQCDESGKKSLYPEGYLDRHQNLTVRSLVHCQLSPKISRKSVRNFLRKVANKQTDRQTNNDDYISSLEEIKKERQKTHTVTPREENKIKIKLLTQTDAMHCHDFFQWWQKSTNFVLLTEKHTRQVRHPKMMITIYCHVTLPTTTITDRERLRNRTERS